MPVQFKQFHTTTGEQINDSNLKRASGQIPMVDRMFRRPASFERARAFPYRSTGGRYCFKNFDEQNDDGNDTANRCRREEKILAKIESLTPEDLLTFGSMQDRIICQVVDKASQDGEAWEKLLLCVNESQQNPLRNVLWVGVLSQDDKNLIFEKAMLSVKEASEKLENFPE